MKNSTGPFIRNDWDLVWMIISIFIYAYKYLKAFGKFHSLFNGVFDMLGVVYFFVMRGLRPHQKSQFSLHY